jgi:hypothetical protein
MAWSTHRRLTARPLHCGTCGACNGRVNAGRCLSHQDPIDTRAAYPELLRLDAKLDTLVAAIDTDNQPITVVVFQGETREFALRRHRELRPYVTKLIARPVVLGITLGLGFGLMIEGAKMMAQNWWVGGQPYSVHRSC